MIRIRKHFLDSLLDHGMMEFIKICPFKTLLEQCFDKEPSFLLLCFVYRYFSRICVSFLCRNSYKVETQQKTTETRSQNFSPGLTTSRAFVVGDVNIFGIQLLIQIRYFFVNNRKTILTHWDCIYFTKFSESASPKGE